MDGPGSMFTTFPMNPAFFAAMQAQLNPQAMRPDDPPDASHAGHHMNVNHSNGMNGSNGPAMSMSMPMPTPMQQMQQMSQMQMQMPLGFPQPFSWQDSQWPGSTAGQQWMLQAAGQFQAMPPSQAALPTHPTQISIPPAPREVTKKDELVLVDTLRRGREKGLTLRQCLEKLHGMNGHSSSEWKDYFLDNIDRLHTSRAHTHSPVTLPVVRKERSSTVESVSSSSRNTLDKTVERRPSQLKREKSIESKPTRPTHEHHGRPTARRTNPAHSSPLKPSPQPRRTSQTTSAAAKVSAVDIGLTRRGIADEYHAYTRIPGAPDTIKPDMPTRDPSTPVRKFTDEDKVFFIHYLRWRLREGTVPKKSSLYKELAEHGGHHKADAWKRHWSDNPELPDRIYIDATKRVRRGGARKPVFSESSSDEEGSEEEEEEEESDEDAENDEDEEDDNEEDDEDEEESSSSDEEDEGTPPPRRRGRPPKQTGNSNKKRKITDDDLRAMAKYLVEQGIDPGASGNGPNRWKEFASRPENTIRSLSGWTSSANYHAQAIALYYAEYLKEERERKKSSPTIVKRDPSADSTDEVEGTLSRKRSADEVDSANDALPEEKRVKQRSPS